MTKFRATWPIEQPSAPRAALIHDAGKDLRAVAHAAGVHVLDLVNHEWSIEGDEVVLTADYQPKCGTTTGFNRHRVVGTPPCDPCRTAQLEYKRLKDATVCGCGMPASRRRGGNCRKCRTKPAERGRSLTEDELEPVPGWVRRGLIWLPLMDERQAS